MFADVVHEAAETEAPYMTDEPNRAFESECRVKLFWDQVLVSWPRSNASNIIQHW